MRASIVKTGIVVLIVVAASYAAIEWTGVVGEYVCTPMTNIAQCAQLVAWLRIVIAVIGAIGLLQLLYGLLAPGEKIIAYPPAPPVVIEREKKPKEIIVEMVFVRCPSCGAKNPEDARFCSECGERLGKRKAEEGEAG